MIVLTNYQKMILPKITLLEVKWSKWKYPACWLSQLGPHLHGTVALIAGSKDEGRKQGRQKQQDLFYKTWTLPFPVNSPLWLPHVCHMFKKQKQKTAKPAIRNSKKKHCSTHVQFPSTRKSETYTACSSKGETKKQWVITPRD